MKRRHVALIYIADVTLFLAGACSFTPPPQHAIERGFVVVATYDQTWSAVMESLAEANLSITTLEKASGLVATDWVPFFGPALASMDCGRGDVTFRDHEAKFNVFVKANGAEATTVQINAVYRCQGAMNADLALSRHPQWRTMTCTSTGKLEATLRDTILSKINGAKS